MAPPGKMFLATSGKIHYCLPLEKILPTPMFISIIANHLYPDHENFLSFTSIMLLCLNYWSNLWNFFIKSHVTGFRLENLQYLASLLPWNWTEMLVRHPCLYSSQPSKPCGNPGRIIICIQHWYYPQIMCQLQPNTERRFNYSIKGRVTFKTRGFLKLLGYSGRAKFRVEQVQKLL